MRSAKGREDPRLTRLCAICLGLPESSRELSGSHATFRVRGKTFAYFLDDHHDDGIVSLCVRTPRGENADWVAFDAGKFYLPAYIGPRGWVGLRLDVGRIDWDEVKGFVTESYRLGAPKRLAARVAAETNPARG